MSQFALLNPHRSQVLHLSSAQLSPNSVHLDLDLDTIDVFPVFPPLTTSREGPFDASTEPAATREHPLISTRRAGCPYRITSYRDDDNSSVDSQFGVLVHHPQFLEWVGAPESAHLLSRSPADWLQVMNRQDTLNAALQLQKDASLMSSHLTVMH